MKRNSFFLGCAAGIPAPLVAGILQSFSSLGATLHPLSLYVLAATVNLLLVRFLYRGGLDRSAYGVVLITFLALLFLIFTDKISLI